MDNNDRKHLKRKIENDLSLLRDDIRDVGEREKLDGIIDVLQNISTWWHD